MRGWIMAVPQIGKSPSVRFLNPYKRSGGRVLINDVSQSQLCSNKWIIDMQSVYQDRFRIESFGRGERFYSFGAMPFLPIKREWRSQNIHLLMRRAVIQTPWVAYSTHRSDLPYAKIFSSAIRHFAFFTCDGAAKTFLPFYASWTSRRKRIYARAESQLVNCGVHAFGRFIIGRSHHTRMDAGIKASEKVVVKHTSNGCILQSSATLSWNSHRVNCFTPLKKTQQKCTLSKKKRLYFWIYANRKKSLFTIASKYSIDILFIMKIAAIIFNLAIKLKKLYTILGSP